jgi:hypothetical protein
LKIVYAYEEIKDPTESLPISLQIYYSLYKKTINVIHIHSLNEKVNLDRRYEIIFIDKKEEANNLKNLPVDTKLRIIFKNYKLNKVFFFDDSEDKVIELRGQEFNLKLERIVRIRSEGYLNNQLAKINKIPIYLLANNNSIELSNKSDEFNISNEKVDVCTFNSMSDSDCLPGYIDLNIVFDQDLKYLDTPIKIALPACMISLIPVMEEMEYEKKFMDEVKKRTSNEMTEFENINNDIVGNYEKFLNNNDLVVSLDKSQIQLLIAKLEQYSAILPKITNFIEENELWTYLEVKILYNYRKF